MHIKTYSTSLTRMSLSQVANLIGTCAVSSAVSFTGSTIRVLTESLFVLEGIFTEPKCVYKSKSLVSGKYVCIDIVPILKGELFTTAILLDAYSADIRTIPYNCMLKKTITPWDFIRGLEYTCRCTITDNHNTVTADAEYHDLEIKLPNIISMFTRHLDNETVAKRMKLSVKTVAELRAGKHPLTENIQRAWPTDRDLEVAKLRKWMSDNKTEAKLINFAIETAHMTDGEICELFDLSQEHLDIFKRHHDLH